MPEAVVKALDYGVLGLCTVMVVYTAWIIYKEQKQDKEPRKGIIIFCSLFMIFCLALALLNAWVQVKESKMEQKVIDYRGKLDRLDDLLDAKLEGEVDRIRSGTASEDMIENSVERLKNVISEARKTLSEESR
jgi:hypothetical protein